MVSMKHTFVKLERLGTVGPGKDLGMSKSRDGGKHIRKVDIWDSSGNQGYIKARLAEVKSSWAEIVTLEKVEPSPVISGREACCWASIASLRPPVIRDSSLLQGITLPTSRAHKRVHPASEANAAGGPVRSSRSMIDSSVARRSHLREAAEDPDSMSCSICTERLDETDSKFSPCSCPFKICLFCYHRIRADDGRCPGCRKVYNNVLSQVTPSL